MEALFTKTVQKVSLITFLALISFGAMAQVTYTDSVCAGLQDKVYGIVNPNPTSTYDWWLSDNTAGSIDSSIGDPSDSIIHVDWGFNPGTYTLYSTETTEFGCAGDTVALDIVVHPLPTVTVAADSVCEGYNPTLTIELTGEAPWTVDYTDGTNNFTTVANSTPHVISLNAYTTSQTITVTGVTDSYSCDADTTALPNTPVTIHPAANTGAIFHY